jgi:hypothetical protein
MVKIEERLGYCLERVRASFPGSAHYGCSAAEQRNFRNCCERGPGLTNGDAFRIDLRNEKKGRIASCNEKESRPPLLVLPKIPSGLRSIFG